MISDWSACTGCLHSGQIRRSSRCAITARNAVAHQKRLHSHVHQSGDRTRGVVGVQRTEHQVAGKRRVDRDFSGFQVADLTDHDDIRRLAEHGAQRRGKGHIHMPVHLHLVDAGELVFDRVFHRDQLAAGGVDRIQERVQRSGLAGTGRPVTRKMPSG